MKKMITKIMKWWVFGTPISGEPATKKPTFKTVLPDGERMDFNEWAKLTNVSSRLAR